MKIRNRVRDESTGAGIPGVDVEIRRVDGGATVASATTDGNGVFDYEATGSPGGVEWAATSGGLTRVVAGDMSNQTGVLYSGELEKLLQGFSPGVVRGVDNECQVVPGTGRQVKVKTGIALAAGIPVIGISDTAVDLAANGSGNPRIDTIVARVTRTGGDEGAAEFDVVAGTPGVSPVAPSLTQTADEWEVPLADIAIANGYSTINSGNITDRRVTATWLAERLSGHATSYGSAPTPTATPAGTYPAAGNGPSGLAITGNDRNMSLALTTGTTPATGRLAHVAFAEPKAGSSYTVQFSENSIGAVLNASRYYAQNRTTTGFDVLVGVAALPASTLVVLSLLVEEYG